MQYRLANPDNEFGAPPPVIIPYTPDASLGDQYKHDASAVELADGRVLYCWSWEKWTSPRQREIRVGHAASVDAFFAASNSVTLDKSLVSMATGTPAHHLRAVINPDPYVGNARIWLQVYLDRPSTECTFDSSVENPDITLDGHYLWTSVDQGVTWDYVTDLWVTQTNRTTLGGFVNLYPPEPVGPGSSYVNPYPVECGLSLIVGQYRQNVHVSNRRRSVIATNISSPSSAYTKWEMEPMHPRVEPPTSTSSDYWRNTPLPLTTDPNNAFDVGWLPDNAVQLYCPMDVPLVPGNPSAGQQSSGARFLGINGGSNNQSWFCRTIGGYVVPTHRIAAGQPGLPENGAAFTIHGHPNRIFWFRNNGTMLFMDDPIGLALLPTDGSTIPSSQTTSPFDESNPVWTGLGGSGSTVRVMKVGDRMAIMWGSRMLGVKLVSPRCQPLPPLHIPYKDWRREKDKRRSAQMALDNAHAVELWAREVFDAGNTATRLHIPISNKGYSQYQFWLSVERWTETLCNRSRVHIPHKRIKSKDETNFLALERWAATVNPNDGPF